MLIKFKKILKVLLPNFVLKIYTNSLLSIKRKKFSKMTTKEVFKEVYEKKLWSPEGEKKKFKFYSGTGSHHKDFSEKYVKEVSKFLMTFKNKPDVVDLGCGDFFIGSQLRKFCNKYVAIDIFDDLIDHNKKIYNDLNVEFKVSDITIDQLPSSEVCFIKDVLQHLSNDLIKKFLRLIDKKYKYLIITEHLPETTEFKANLDVPTSAFIRLDKNSGVVLTEEPFNLQIIRQFDLCNITSKTIKKFQGVRNTKVLQLK